MLVFIIGNDHPKKPNPTNNIPNKKVKKPLPKPNK